MAEGERGKDARRREVAWPFCGISGARHSIWRDMLPPYATVVTLVVGGGEEDK